MKNPFFTACGAACAIILTSAGGLPPEGGVEGKSTATSQRNTENSSPFTLTTAQPTQSHSLDRPNTEALAQQKHLDLQDEARGYEQMDEAEASTHGWPGYVNITTGEVQ